MGRNGEGKSTLASASWGELEHEGTLTLGDTNVRIGYFAQNQASLLDENLTVFQTIDGRWRREIRNNDYATCSVRSCSVAKRARRR